MSDLGDKFFKAITGKPFDEATRLSDVDSSVDKILKTKRSQFPLIRLGWAQDGEVLMTEEERFHFHILGLPGKGKSKFLELLIRHDIDRLHRWHKDKSRPKVPGLCLIDSSDFGNTYKKILRYCRQIGFNKVCVIDPHDYNDGTINKVPAINAFGRLIDGDDERKHYNQTASTSASHIANIFRVLWDDEDFSKIARITQYLRAVIETIHSAQGTLADIAAFSYKDNPQFQALRTELLSKSKQHSHSRMVLEEMFYYSNQSTFNQEFRSTIRRVDPTFVHPFPLMVCSTENTIDFQKLISDGWVILCNLDPEGVWDVPQQRLLGTLVIHELIRAMYRLVENGYHVPFYLYIDEVGRYATEVLSEVIHYKRTSNIRLLMAHQEYEQIRIKSVLTAIENSPNKVLFYVERQDRDRMVRNMYGGELPEHMVSYTLSQELGKQKAVIKLGQMRPRITKIVDLPDVPEDRKADQEFKAKLYEQPWYRSRTEAEKELHDRHTRAEVYGPPGGYETKRLPKQKTRKGKGTHTRRTVEPAGGQPHTQEDPQDAGYNRVFDNPPSRPPLLRNDEEG